MINIAELLKDSPKDLKLYSPICGYCKLSCILYDDAIRVIAHDVPFRFDKYGRFCSADDAECLLFPSKDCKTWEGWKLPVVPKFKVGDRVIFNGKVRTITFMDEDYYDFDGGVAGCRIELQDELKPASNFKKGDLLIHNNNPTCRVLVVDVNEKYGYQLQDGCGRYHLSFNIIENEYHLWSMADAKDGDVLVTTKIRSCPFIYRKPDFNNDLAYYYVGIDGNGNLSIGWPKKTLCHFGLITDAVIAGREQRDLLFKKIKDAGYKWDADKKELRKIQPHYDISNFHAGMPVLARDKDNRKWCYLLYSHYDNTYEDGICFNAGSVDWRQCIPFEGNEHLLGTTDPCGEEFINW